MALEVRCEARQSGCLETPDDPEYKSCSVCRTTARDAVRRWRARKKVRTLEGDRTDLRAAALRAPRRKYRAGRARTTVVRASSIRLYALERAQGVCECGCGVAFEWLDVHHIHALGRGGADSIYNAIALRPDCHRRADRDSAFNATLYARMEVLEPCVNES